MSKEAYYFSHDANARNDEKILMLRDELGWAAYGQYWAVVESLRESSDYTLSNATAVLKQILSITKEDAEQFYSTALKVGLFKEKDGRFYSESLMNRMEAVDIKHAKRAEAGRKGGNAKANSSNTKAMPEHYLANKRKESKIKENTIESDFDFEKSFLQDNDHRNVLLDAWPWFWNTYDKKINEPGTKFQFMRLSGPELEKIQQHLPKYVKANEKQFRKNPDNYLIDKTFNDEIINRTSQAKPSQTTTVYQRPIPKNHNAL